MGSTFLTLLKFTQTESAKQSWGDILSNSEFNESISWYQQRSWQGRIRKSTVAELQTENMYAKA
jgi:hypothetical protein